MEWEADEENIENKKKGRKGHKWNLMDYFLI